MTPFVGRHQEGSRLRTALRKAAAGEPQVVVLTGDAGIGKTRLLTETVRQAGPDWLVAAGHCVEAGANGLPYAPLSGVLGAIAANDYGAAMLEDAHGLRPLLGGETPADTTSGLAQFQLFDALLRLFGALAEQRPTLLVIEDLHWADESTCALLSFLCRNLPPKPLAVLVTARTDELHRTHRLRPLLAELSRLPAATGIELGPLPDTELADLLAGRHGAPVPREVVRSIARRSGGNPFFAEELWAAGAGESTADHPLPGGLTDVLLLRVDRLTEDAQHLLRTAAIAGRRVGHDLLIAVAALDQDRATAALRECADARIFEPEPGGDAFAFRHALLAEAIAADVVPTERRALHARFVDALAGTAPAAVVARHCLGAADLPGAFAWSVDAAEEAAAVAAPDDALAHWERVLQLWDHGTLGDQVRAGSRHAVGLAASNAATQAGRMAHAAELARLAVDEAGTGRERAAARLALAPLLTPLVTGRPDEEISVARAAIVDAGDDAELAARARFVLARAYLLAGRFRDAVPLADQARADAESLGIADTALGARATAFLARCHLGEQDPAEEDALAAAAADCPDVETGLWVLTRLADWWWPTDPVKGERSATAAYDLAGRHGIGTSVRAVWARETLVLCRWLTGHWDAIVDLARTEPLAVNDATSGTVALECQVDIARGRFDVARRKLDLAAKVTTDALGRAFLAIASTDLSLAEGDPAGAAAHSVESLTQLPPELGFADFEAILVGRGIAALADAVDSGIDVDGSTLIAAADRIEQRASAEPNRRLSAIPLSALRAHRSRLTGRADPALWRAAIELRAEQPFEIARCRYFLAAALLPGDPDEAHRQLATAVETCRELGAAVLLERIEALLFTRP